MRKPASTSSKPSTKPEAVSTVVDQPKPVTAKPEPTEAEILASRIERRVSVDARTILRYATHFGNPSSRDDAYLAFFGLASTDEQRTFTLAAAAALAGGRNPLYIGSNKATDAGAINRLRKAGLIVADADGRTYTFTDAGRSAARAIIAKHTAAAEAAAKPEVKAEAPCCAPPPVAAVEPAA